MAILRLTALGQMTALDALLALCDGGDIEFYHGPIPTDPDNEPIPAGNTLLTRLNLNADAFANTNAQGSASINPVSDGIGLVSQDADWARFRRSAAHSSAVVFIVDAGTAGKTLNGNTSAIRQGGVVTVTGGTITIPKG